MSSAAYAVHRARFVADSVGTASPARLLTLLYDRLVLDLARGEASQRLGDRSAAAEHLVHAQEIILELRGSLRTEGWEGGPGLASLYTFLHAELVRANVAGDPDATGACLRLVEPLREAWHAAALEASARSAVAAGA